MLVPPPPQAGCSITAASTTTSSNTKSAFFRRGLPARLSTIPGSSSANVSGPSLSGLGGRSAAKVFAVLMLRTTIAGDPLGVTVVGEKEHAAPFGKPEQEKETESVNGSATGVTNSSYCPEWPAAVAAA